MITMGRRAWLSVLAVALLAAGQTAEAFVAPCAISLRAPSRRLVSDRRACPPPRRRNASLEPNGRPRCLTRWRPRVSHQMSPSSQLRMAEETAEEALTSSEEDMRTRGVDARRKSFFSRCSSPSRAPSCDVTAHAHAPRFGFWPPSLSFVLVFNKARVPCAEQELVRGEDQPKNLLRHREAGGVAGGTRPR